MQEYYRQETKKSAVYLNYGLSLNTEIQKGAGGSRTHAWRICNPLTTPENAEENDGFQQGAAQTTAVDSKIDPQASLMALAEIITAWPKLSELKRIEIVRIVRS